MTNGERRATPRHFPLHFLLVLFVVLWLLPDAAAWLARKPDEIWARVRASGAIRFATEASYHPFSGVGGDGVFYGLDVDVAREVARRLGLRAEFDAVGIDALYDALRVGRADASISALPVDPARLGQWAYSRPYFDDGLLLIAREDSGLKDASELPGHAIAVEGGSDADALLRYYQRRAGDIRAVRVTSADGGLLGVGRGLADAAIVDGLTARQLLPTQFPGLRIVTRLTSKPYAIALWGESLDLRAAIDRVLDDMRADGTLERIIADWMKR